MNLDQVGDLPVALTVHPQASGLLGIGRDAAYRAVASGEIPSLKLGRRIVVPTARLLALLGIEHDEAAPIRQDQGRSTSEVAA